ncbi:MAG: FAD:protein FMN transferase, partial [Flavisolibacter sp.]
MNVHVRRILLCASLFAGVLGVMSFITKNRGKLYVSNYENVLGTSMEIKISADGEQKAMRAEQLALTEIDRLNKILSGYDSSSEFRRWMNGNKEPVSVSPELFEVLSLFEQWRVRSSGALDASAETISKVWRDAAKQNRLPSEIEISNAVMTIR